MVLQITYSCMFFQYILNLKYDGDQCIVFRAFPMMWRSSLAGWQPEERGRGWVCSIAWHRSLLKMHLQGVLVVVWCLCTSHTCWDLPSLKSLSSILYSSLSIIVRSTKHFWIECEESLRSLLYLSLSLQLAYCPILQQLTKDLSDDHLHFFDRLWVK